MQLLEHEKKHLEMLRPALAECTVLLRTDGEFPLDGPCRIAAIGNGVRRTVKGGKGSGEVNSRYFVNVEKGLEEAGFTVTTGKWMDAYDELYAEARRRFMTEVKAEARAHHQMAVAYAMGRTMPEPEYGLPQDLDADACIFVLARDSGEGSDRQPVKGDVLLTDSEKRDILKLNGRYRKFMLVLNTGAPVDLSGLDEVRNILILSQLGVETGAALADILLGRQNPSGKLATTWTAWKDYPQIGGFGQHDDTDYKEGIYVGYRYFNSVGRQVMFPFGFGLSYTTFRIEPQPVELDGSKVSVSAEVTNTGKHSGKEVVQVYVSCPQGKLDKPYQDLAGFAKSRTLKPGESCSVTVKFDMKDLASFSEDRCAHVLEHGGYIIRCGNSSASTIPVAVVELDEDVEVLKVRHAFGNPSFTDWKPETQIKHDVPDFIPVLKMEASSIKPKSVEYDRTYPIDDIVKQMTDEQLATAVLGSFKDRAGILGIIGDASSLVPGAAGEAGTRVKACGFRPMVLADGPAGIRIAPEVYRDRKGIHGTGTGHSESFLEFLPGIAKWFIRTFGGGRKAPKGAALITHYCTAIPIGTALAQSWNVDLAHMCGDIVGREMEMFGVHLWLAPAMNIHRSILCGRNFEYFSEDPLISGRMAAAITKGVQKHPGCGTTIKHFAANNQETNRYGSSSNASERALREIYLKGFGIAVRDSQPKAVMTSYNLINGVHTAERRDLIEDILRCEFGFKGIVMTDWVVADGAFNSAEDYYPKVKPQLTAAAGSDLFMPGCRTDLENMLKGLRDRTVTKEQLQICATRVYRMGKELAEKKSGD